LYVQYAQNDIMSQVYQNNLRNAERERKRVANELKSLERERERILEINRRRDQLAREMAELDRELGETSSDDYKETSSEEDIE
jgi:hypothetical protein